MWLYYRKSNNYRNGRANNNDKVIEVAKKEIKEVEEKETYICMNHEPSWIFKTSNPDPLCPLCKLGNYVSTYSGDRKPIRKRKDNHEER